MSFFFNTLLALVVTTFTPKASAAIIIVHSGSGLSPTTRIIIIVVSIVLFFLTLACRIAKIRENGRAERAKREAAAPVMTAATGTPNANNYASQGPGGYNGYTLPPRPVQAQYPPSRKPDQSEWKPQPAQGYPAAPYPLPGDTNGPTAEKDGELPGTDVNPKPQQHYISYPPPDGAAVYQPPQGPPPTGYDAAPPSAPPPAHTTGQDPSGGYQPR